MSMRKTRILLFLGVWVAILPFLGFPYSWKDTLSFVTGLILICFSYLLYKDYKITEKTFDNFKENNDFSEKEVENPETEKSTSLENNEEEI